MAGSVRRKHELLLRYRTTMTTRLEFQIRLIAADAIQRPLIGLGVEAWQLLKICAIYDLPSRVLRVGRLGSCIP